MPPHAHPVSLVLSVNNNLRLGGCIFCVFGALELSFQLVQVFKPRQDNLFASLFNLASKEDLVENSIYFVKVENKIKLTHVSEESVEHLNEEVNCLEVGEFVVVGVDAGAEEEAGVAAVDDLIISELDKIGLVLLIAGGDEAVDFAFELDLLVVAVGSVPLG